MHIKLLARGILLNKNNYYLKDDMRFVNSDNN